MTITHGPLELDPFGIRVEFLRNGEETGGELLEMEVSGRPHGFLSQRHVHPHQTERLEVLSGAMKVSMNGREHLLEAGQSVEVPPGTPHTPHRAHLRQDRGPGEHRRSSARSSRTSPPPGAGRPQAANLIDEGCSLGTRAGVLLYVSSRGTHHVHQ